MSRSRILFLANSAEIGGGNCSLLTLWDARVFQERFSACCVLPAEGPMEQECVRREIPCTIAPYVGPPRLRVLASIHHNRLWRDIFRHYRPDLLHANGSRGMLAAGRIAKSHSVPTICHCRAAGSPDSYRQTYRYAANPDAVVFNSYYMQNKLGGVFHECCPHAKQHVVYNAVDVAAFRNAPRTVKTALSRVGIIANLNPVKGHELFLAAAEILVKRNVRAEFWIVGGPNGYPDYEDRLREIVEKTNLRSFVHFKGFRNDVASLMCDLDVIVCTSHEEAFGRCVVEAMACEKPVVVGNVGGLPEVVVDGECGFIVTREAACFANAIEDLLANSELCRRMGQAGRRRVEELFTASAHAENLARIYERYIE